MAKAGTAWVEFKGDFSTLERQIATKLPLLAKAVEVDVDSSQVRVANRDLAETNRTMRGVSSRATSLGGAMSRTNTQFQFLRNSVRLIKWPAMIAGVGAATQGISALTAGTVGLTGALGPLSGLLTTIPAGLGVLGQSAGTAALAFSGLGDVLGAMNDVQVSAGKSAEQLGETQHAAAEQVRSALESQRSAVEQVRSAEASLAGAQRGAKFAQEDLNQAREDAVLQLQDMRLAADASALSEKRAALALEEAHKALTKARDAQAPWLEIRSLMLGVEEAEQALREARREGKRSQDELNESERKGINQAPEVVAARRALADAHRDVADANDQIRDANRQVVKANRDLVEAQRETTDALGETSSAADALREKMAGLPLAAQDFARFLFSLKPQLEELQATAAQGLLPGIEQGFRAALANFPALRQVIGETARAMGNLSARVGEFVGRAGFGRDFLTLGRGNARALGNMGDAALHLADALRHVMVGAQPLLRWLGRSVEQFSAFVEQEAKAGRESGRLADFFEKTRSVTERLVSIGGSLAAVFQEIGQAAAPLGREVLRSLDEGANHLERWAESTQGRNSLRDYFTNAQPAVLEMGRLLRDVSESFFRMGNTPGLDDLIRKLRVDLLPVFEQLTTTMTEAFAPRLVDFAVEFGKLLENFSGAAGPLSRFVEMMTAVVRIFNELLETPVIKQLSLGILSFAAAVKTLKFAGAITGISTLIGMMGKLRTATVATTGATSASSIMAASSMFGGQTQMMTTVASKSGAGIGRSLISGMKGFLGGPAGLPVIAGLIASTLAGIEVGRSGALSQGRSVLGLLQADFDLTRNKASNLMRFMKRNPGLGVPEALEGLGETTAGVARRIDDALNRISTTSRDRLRELTRDARDTGQAITRSQVEAWVRSGQISTREGAKMLDVLRDVRQEARQTRDAIARGQGMGIGEALVEDRQITKNELDRIKDELALLGPKARREAGIMALAVAQNAREAGDIGKGEFRDLRQVIESETGKITRTQLREGVKQVRGMGQIYTAIDNVVEVGLRYIADETKNALGKLGAKVNLGWTVGPAKAIGAGLLNALTNRQRGGFINVGAPSGDSVPAMLERDEYVLNRRAVEKVGVDRLDALNFGQAPRFRAGGAVGDVGGLEPGVLQLAAMLANRFGMTVTSGLRGTDTGSLHSTGQAADFAGGDFGGASRYVNSIGAQLLEGIYNPGDFGGSAVSWDVGRRVSPSFWGGEWANHLDHIHAAIAGAGGKLGAVVRDIKRVLLKGPAGLVRDLGQGALDKVHKAANELIAAKLPRVTEGSYGVSTAGYGSGQAANRKLGREMMLRRFGAAQWPFLDHLWGVDEGTWDENLANLAGSGAYGIAQALPASKYPPAGQPSAPPGIRKAAAQIGWGLGYIGERYGTPKAADAFRHRVGWYRKGGIVQKLARGGKVNWSNFTYGPGAHGGGGGGYSSLNQAGNYTGPFAGWGNAVQPAAPAAVAARGHDPLSVLAALFGARATAERLAEQVSNAEVVDAFFSSPAGQDLSPKELAGQVALNTSLLGWLTWQRDLARLSSTLFPPTSSLHPEFLSEILDLEGATGAGGSILDVKRQLDSLNAPLEVIAAATEDNFDRLRADLLFQQLTEARRSNAILRNQMPVFEMFNRAPFHHSGGVVGGQGNQPIIAQGGEGLFTREQMQAMGGGEIHNHFYIDGEEIRGITRVEVEGKLQSIARGASARGGVIGRKAAYP